mmetsp:Transcript_44812/g.103520  ORF Transcript_44812/g.103520 Transcript_44812/m.103520 type:complete len:200 (-) Transcript_44812:631-1230(-)
MLDFCKGLLLALKLLFFEDLPCLPLAPPIGGSKVPSSGSSPSLTPPAPPKAVGEALVVSPCGAGGAPAFRRSCRMVGSPATAGLSGWLGFLTSGVREWSMLAVLLLGLITDVSSFGGCSRAELRGCVAVWKGVVVPAARSLSASRRSLKYGSLSACRASIRSSGSYLISFLMSSTTSGSACGTRRSMPVPFFSGKFRSM